MTEVTSASCLLPTKEIIYTLTKTTGAGPTIDVFSTIAGRVESTLDGVEKRFAGGSVKIVGYRIR